MGHDGSILDLHTVEFKRLLPGPIELAWDYLTKPELLKTWFNDVTLEPRIGGTVEVRFTDGKGECSAGGVHGTVREFRKPKVLAFSWTQRRAQSDGSIRDSDEGEVRFELFEQGDKVLLTLLHSRLPTQELPNYSGGWHAYLDSLESRLSGQGGIEVMAAFHRLRPRYDERVAALQRQGAA
jgi:uncharacterized protein YndB with AHSA1/START domain